MSAPSEMEEMIHRIACELWQIDGEPAGRDQEHWERARRIFESRKAHAESLGNGNEARGRTDHSPSEPAREMAEPRIVSA
jgi:Protein of unknown function (DUF2934)